MGTWWTHESGPTIGFIGASIGDDRQGSLLNHLLLSQPPDGLVVGIVSYLIGDAVSAEIASWLSYGCLETKLVVPIIDRGSKHGCVWLQIDGAIKSEFLDMHNSLL